jgi:hypothetical protein
VGPNGSGTSSGCQIARSGEGASSRVRAAFDVGGPSAERPQARTGLRCRCRTLPHRSTKLVLDASSLSQGRCFRLLTDGVAEPAMILPATGESEGPVPENLWSIQTLLACSINVYDSLVGSEIYQ